MFVHVLALITGLMAETGATHQAACQPRVKVVAVQGSVRDNLDPMGRHSDRELIAVLKSTRLWDILCGVSLSQSKGLARALAAQSTAAQPPRSASRPIQPRSPTAGSLRAGAPHCRLWSERLMFGLCFGSVIFGVKSPAWVC